MSYRYIQHFPGQRALNCNGVLFFFKTFYSTKIDLDLKSKTALIELEKLNSSLSAYYGVLFYDELLISCPFGLYKYLYSNPDNIIPLYSFDSEYEKLFISKVPDKYIDSITYSENKTIVKFSRTLYELVDCVKFWGIDSSPSLDFLIHYLHKSEHCFYFSDDLEVKDFDLLNSIAINKDNIITHYKYYLDGHDLYSIHLYGAQLGKIKSTSFNVAINLYAWRQDDKLFISDNSELVMCSPFTIPFWILPEIKDGEIEQIVLKYF